MSIKSKQKQKKQPLKYWLVELTLTSGEVLTFYIKALNQFEADEKAYGYGELVSIKQFKNKMRTFSLFP